MRDLSPQPVFCVIEHLHQSCRVATDALAGVFELAGQRASMGRTPDWLGADFPTDEEWRIEFSKFYFGLDLAHLYSVSGNCDALAAWLDLVTSWIQQVDPEHDTTDVAARRIQNWTYAWSCFAAAGVDAAAFGDGIAETIVESIARQSDHIRANLSTERNHRTLELYALLVVALAFPAIDRCGKLAAFAVFEIDRNLRADVLADGVHRELSTHYHAVALRSFVAARINAHRFGLSLPAGYDERLALALEFLACVMRPDGSLPMLSDSDDGDHRQLLELGASILDRPDLAWVASGGHRGRPPAHHDAKFTSGGYCVQRSGWGDGDRAFADEAQLILDCGPVGDSGHGHYDALHIEVFDAGRPLLIDPGRHTYSEAGDINWRHWFKGTAAHNTVCVDGLDQMEYRRGKPKGPMPQTRLLHSACDDRVASLTAEVVSPCYDAVHRRRVIFVDRRWWIIEDSLRAISTHRYDLRFHLTPEAFLSTEILAPGVVAAPGFVLRAIDSDGLGPPAARLETGWVSRSYGNRRPSPVVSLRRDGDDVRFVTLIVPGASRDHDVDVLRFADAHLDAVVLGERISVDWSKPTMVVAA